MVGSVEDFCERVRRGLADATFEQRRRLVELLIDRVIVTDEEVEIRYVIPTDPSSEHIRFCHLRSDYLHYPATRQYPETLWRHELLPIHLFAFLGPLSSPRLQDFLWGRFARTFDKIHRPPQNLLHPASALIFTPVAGVQPQMAKTRKQLSRALEQRPDPLLVDHVGCMYLCFSTKPSVSTSKCRFLPLTFLPPSYPRSSPPTQVVFTDWLSTMPALG